MSVAPATTESIFGPLISGWDVEQWVLAVLKKWSGTYLAEYERQHGIAAGTLPAVRAWHTMPTFDKWPEDQLPCVVIVSVGFAEPPKREGSGRFRVSYLLNVGCVCSARTEQETRELALAYLAAHELLLTQRPSLEGHAAGIRLLPNDYAILPADDVRSLGAASAGIEVEVLDAFRGDAGPVTPAEPLVPETTPWPDWPTTQTVQVEVDGYGTDPLPPKGGKE